MNPLYNDSVSVKSPHTACSNNSKLTQVMLTPAGKKKNNMMQDNAM